MLSTLAGAGDSEIFSEMLQFYIQIDLRADELKDLILDAYDQLIGLEHSSNEANEILLSIKEWTEELEALAGEQD